MFSCNSYDNCYQQPFRNLHQARTIVSTQFTSAFTIIIAITISENKSHANCSYNINVFTEFVKTTHHHFGDTAVLAAMCLPSQSECKNGAAKLGLLSSPDTSIQHKQ